MLNGKKTRTRVIKKKKKKNVKDNIIKEEGYLKHRKEATGIKEA